MSVQIEIPESVFALPVPEISRHVLEAAAVEGFRANQLSVYQVQKMLDFESRSQAQDFLMQNGLPWVNYSVEDLERERAAIKDLLKK